MSHLLQQKKKQVLITTHTLVTAAWEFVPPNSSEDEYGSQDRGRRIAALICTAPLSRALVANVFVQTRKHLQHTVVDFFLHNKVIPAFRIPIMFVYCVLMNCYNSTSQNPISTVERISETMPHIQTLDVEDLPRLDEQQLALAAALPKTLWSLCLAVDFCFSAGFVSQLAESCPFLHRLELHTLDSEASNVLFSCEQNLFPNLRTLFVSTKAVTSSELYDRVFTSQVVSSPKLESLAFCAAGTAQPFPAPSLKPLERLGSISKLLKWAKLTTVPDFSVLNCCSEVDSDLLYGVTFTGDQEQQQQQQQVVVDLSGMPCLTSLGRSTLGRCKGVHSLVLPSTLRTVGSGFCSYSAVQHIDFSLCAESLRFVDTASFLLGGQIEKFSTAPLRGKIGPLLGACFLSCCSKLSHVDLAGLQGIVEIKDHFLTRTAVEELDISALGPTCTKIGSFFLSQCSSLEKVTGCDGLRNVKSVGCGFLSGTEKLAQFDFAAMQALEEVEMGGFLEDSALQVEGTKILSDTVEKNRRTSSNM